MNQLAPAREDRKGIIDLLRDPKVISGLQSVATKYLTAERMTRICINAIRRTPKLAQCNPQSVLGSVMISTALGLEPNSPLGHAYLIPYDKRGKLANGQWGVIDTECQFIIGYRGYISLAKRNPALVKIYASLICEKDLFEFMEGSESFLKFSPALKEGRGKPIGAFCFTKERGSFGDVDATTVLPMEEIEKIRSKSETFKSLSRAVSSADSDFKRKKAEENLAATPWVEWLGEMAAKSAIRRHVKQLDLTHGLAVASDIDGLSEIGAIDMTALANPDMARAVAEGEEEVPMLEHQQEEPTPVMQGPDHQQAASTASRGSKRSKAVAPTPDEPEPGSREPGEDDDDGAPEQGATSNAANLMPED